MPLTLANVVESLRGGMVQSEAGLELHRAIERIQETGKKAKLTITLELMPAGPENREVHVSASLKATLPPKQGVSDASMFYAERGKLFLEDPAAIREANKAVAQAMVGNEEG